MTAQPPRDYANVPTFIEADLREACMHDDELTTEIVNTALEDIPLNFGRLMDGLEEGRLDDACRAAHSLKSVARQVGGHQLSEIMAAQEKCLHLGQRPPEDLLKLGQSAWLALENGLRTFLG